MNTECLLATLPGSSDCERLTVVLVHAPGGTSKMSIRQQTWAEGIGWYDQKSIELDPDQLCQLRAVLGWGTHHRLKQEHAQDPAVLAFPGVVRIESA